MKRALPSYSGEDTKSMKNLPAPINLVDEKNQEPTLFCGNSEILSQGNLFLQKDEWNNFNVWVPLSSLAGSNQAAELLSSLGIQASKTAILGTDSYIEFKCAIDSINLISGKDMGVKSTL